MRASPPHTIPRGGSADVIVHSRAVDALEAAAVMDPLTKKEMLSKFHETCEQYVVDYLIGQGAFGKVFKAHRKDNPGKFVAIKHMNSVREVD